MSEDIRCLSALLHHQGPGSHFRMTQVYTKLEFLEVPEALTGSNMASVDVSGIVYQVERAASVASRGVLCSLGGFEGAADGLDDGATPFFG